MEIELELTDSAWLYTIVLVAVMVMVGLGLIGYWVTPADGGVLTWSEWQVFQAQRRFQRERALLQNQAQTLYDLMASKQRDPVRAQLVVRALLERVAEVQSPALDVPKARLQEAAQAVLDWERGTGDYNRAVEALQAFTDTMDALDEP